MKEVFEKIRKLQKDLTNGQGQYAKAFGAQFFESAPWFLNKAQIRPISVDDSAVIPQVKEEVTQTTEASGLTKEIRLVKEAQSTSEEAPKVESEKEQTLKSLEKFAEEKTQTTEGSKFKFDGGELNLKKNQKESMAFSFDRKTVDSPDSYLKEKYTEATNLTFVNGGEFINLQEGVKILFVGEKKIDDLKDFDEGIHWSAEATEKDLLGKMIHAMKLKSGEFVRTFLVGESQDCLETICLEIEALKPDVVISLGALATNILLGKKERLSHVHGEFFTRSYKFSDRDEVLFKVVPIFHPDFLEITPTMKRTAWTDLQKVMEFLDEKP